MPSSRISGCFGFTIIPDGGTMEKARSLSEEYSPNAAPKRFHLPLYYTVVGDANLAFMIHVLRFIRKDLKGSSLTFSDVNLFGGRSIHWRLQGAHDNLITAHYACLGFSIYQDKEAKLLQEFEELQLSEGEQCNLKEHGHPLVEGHFEPHVCLGKLNGTPFAPKQEPHRGFVENVHLVRIGPWETIEEILTED